MSGRRTVGGRSRRLNLVATIGACAVLCASLVYAAVQADGYEADHVTLHDNGVWVIRNSIELGRLNYDLQKVDTKSATGIFGTIVDVHQSDDVVIVETADQLFAYDVALNVSRGDGMPKPVGGAEVSIGGDNGAYLDIESQRLWFTDRTGVTAIDTTPAKLTGGSIELPGASRLLVGPDGVAHVAAATSNTVWTFVTAWGTGQSPTATGTASSSASSTSSPADTSTSAVTPSTSVGPDLDPESLAGVTLEQADLSDPDLQMTTAGTRAIFLSGRQLFTDDNQVVTLPTEVGDAPQVQLPSSDPDRVLVGSSTGLVLVSLSDGSAEVVHAHDAGGAIRPVWLNGCAYGAWSDEVFSSCSAETTKPRSSTSDARFRTNRERVALNYADGTLDIFLDGEIRTLDNKWDDAFDPDQKDETEESEEQKEEENKCEAPATNHPPVAVQDIAFTVREGQSTKLDVLRPPVVDALVSDADCDVLTVSIPADRTLAPELGVIAVIDDGRAFQYTPPGSPPTAPVSFEYLVSDGHDGAAAAASASITVVPADDPGRAPQANLDRTTVEVGKTVVIDVLANDWDPEGDAINVVSATLADASDGTLVWQPSGRFAFTAPGSGVGTKSIAYTIRDSRGLTSESTLEVNVISAGVKSPPNTLSDSRSGMLPNNAIEKKTFTINVIANDSDPNGDAIRLVDVVAYPEERTKAVRDDAGNVSITPEAPGAYNFLYTVVDVTGETAQGRIRFEILEAQGSVAPVAVSDAAIVSTERPIVVDVLRNDTDLNGDLLMISAADLPEDAREELNIEVLEHRLVRVSAKTSSLARSAYSFNYTVSDGTLTSTTTVNLGVATTASQQPPVALEDRGEVHLGGYLAIPVLSNDFDPGGNPLTVTEIVLDDKVAAEGAPGIVFIQGGQLRYLAPSLTQRPGPFTATGTYTISNGRDSTNGRFTVSVTDPRNGNRPPSPAPLELRTVEGVAVTLTLPSHGLDPDGDPVELVGQESSPEPKLGSPSVSEDGASITYTPLPGKTGADSFRWQLQDYKDIGYLDVRVVIAPRPAGNSPPVAVADVVQVELDKTTALPVLANDTDPDAGDSIGFAPDRPFDQPNTGAGIVAEGSDGFLLYEAPATEGDYAFNYYITDGDSAPVRGLVRVVATTREKIVNRPPTVRDVVLKPHRAGEVVTIELSDYASDPEGQPLAFGPGADAGPLDVAIVDDGASAVLTVTMTAEPMLFTFVVDDGFPNGLSRAVVQIPSPENRGPTVNVLEYTIEEDQPTLTIDIPAGTFVDPDGDAVVVRQDTKPTVEPVEASGGGEMAWDSDSSFTFNRNMDFGGTAKLTYFVVDEPPTGNPIVTPGTILLTIKKQENRPPVVQEGALDVASGTEVTFDLAQLVTDEDPEDQANLTFSNIAYDGPALVTATPVGARVTVAAELQAALEGETKAATVTFTVSDGKENGEVTGTLRVTIRPTDLARPQAVDDLQDPVKQGESPTWNLLVNDPPNGAGPYTIVSVSASDRGAVTIVGSDSVRFTPTPATSGPTSFQYTIEDSATRQATATVRTSVEDKPSAPTQPTVGEQLSKTAVVSFARPNDNGSPIDSFEVRGSPGGATACTGSPCTVNGLANGVEHTFEVRAHNGVGWSDWSPPSSPYTPDELPGTPPTPQTDWNDRAATVTWGAIPNAGSDIIDVTVTISPSDAAPIVSSGGQGGGTVSFNGLQNGTAYTFSLVARNKKGNSPASPPSASVVPAGPPSFPAAPSLIADNGFVTVSWPTADGNGDDNLTYTVKLIDQGGPTTSTPVGATLTKQLPAVNGHTYRAIINVSNKYSARYAPVGVDSAQSNADKAIGPPKAPPSVTAVAGAGNGAVQVTWGAADANGGTIATYQVSTSGGPWENVGTATGFAKGGLTLGQSYSFSVRALNDNRAGLPGDTSAPSNAATPYTPPAQPAVSCSRTNGYAVTCSWGVGALNGPGPEQVSVTGIVSSGAPAGSAQTGVLGYNQTAGLTVRVCNGGAHGNNCSERATTANTGDYRAVSSSRGSLYGACQVGGGNCYNIVLNISGFLPGPHTFTCFNGAVVAGRTWSGTINADGNGNGGITTANTPPYCNAGNSSAAGMAVEGIGASGGW